MAQLKAGTTIGGVAGGLIPAGMINAFGGSSAPSGFLLCNGTSYLRTEYSGLFSAIGTAYGTADGTHFNVPDLRGTFLRGTDDGVGVDPDAGSRTALKTGGATGDNVGSKQDHQLDSHNHSMRGTSVTGGGGAFENRTQTGMLYTGSTGGNETRPTNVYVKYIIKT